MWGPRGDEGNKIRNLSELLFEVALPVSDNGDACGQQGTSTVCQITWFQSILDDLCDKRCTIVKLWIVQKLIYDTVMFQGPK